MSEGLDFPINVPVNTTQVQNLVSLLNLLSTAGERGQSVTAGLVTKTKELADAEGRTLQVYQQSIKLLNDFTAAQAKSVGSSEQMANVTKNIASAFTTLNGALGSITGTEKEEFTAKSATLRLYQQTIALSQQSAGVARTEAQTILALAQAEKEMASAKLASAKATETATTASRTAAGLGTPQTGNNAADNAMRQAALDRAAATRQLQAAQDAQAATDRQAAQTATQTAAADRQAATAARERVTAIEGELSALRATVAAGAAATAASEATATATTNVAHSAGSAQFALYQVAYAYKELATVALAVGTAPIAVAESFQTAFAQVQRTLDVSTSTAEIQNLRNSLVNLSTAVPVAFENLSAIATLGNQLGIAAGDVASFTDTVAKFSVLTKITGEQTAQFFGQISNLLRIPADQLKAFSSSILELGNKSAATEPQILSVITQISAASKSAGLSTQDVDGLATALASLKVPPELARGTLTRLFGGMEKAAAQGGDSLHAYAVLLGTTDEAAKKLEQSNPGAFFQSLIQALSKVQASGGDFNTTLNDIGIKSVRDVSVIQRLAGNYDLLANSIQLSYASYERGKTAQNALDYQSGIVFATLSAQITESQNSMKAFLDSVGSSTLGPLNLLVAGFKGFFDLLTSLPEAVKNPVFALALIVGGVAAFRGALALAMAAIVAFRQVVGTSVGSLGISIAGLRAALDGTYLQGGVAANAGANSVVGANGRIVASQAGVLTGAQRIQVEDAKIAAASIAVVEATNRMTLQTNLQSAGLSRLSLAVGTNTGVIGTNASAAELNAIAKTYMTKADLIATGQIYGMDGALATETAALLELEAAQFTAAAGAARLGAANVAAAAETVAAAGAAAAAGGAMRATGLLGFLGGPWGIGLTIGITALAAALPLLNGLLNGNSDAAAAAAAKQQELADKFIQSVGGIDALNKAIQTDTATLPASTTAITNVEATNGAYKELVRTIQDLNNGSARVVDAWKDLNGNTISTVADDVYKYADSAKAAAGSAIGSASAQDSFGHSVGLTNDQLVRQTVVLGNATKAAAAKALVDQVIGDKGQGALLSPEQIANARKQGVDVAKALALGVTQGASAVRDSFKPITDGLVAQIATLQVKFDAASKGAFRAGPVTGQLKEQLDGLKAQLAAYNSISDAVTGQNKALDDAISHDSVLGGVLKSLGLDTLNATDGTDALTGALTANSTASQSAVVTTQDLATQFSTLATAAFSTIDALGAVSAAYENLGKSIANNGTDFSAQTDAGRANLKALEDTVNAESQVLQQGIANGQITAQAAAVQMQDYIKGLVNTLATQGVDTSQLDFLVQYVSAIVANPAVWQVSTDVNQGVSNLNALSQYAAQVQAQIAAIPSIASTVTGNTGEHDAVQGATGYVTVHPAVPAMPSFNRQAIQDQISQANATQSATNALEKQKAAASGAGSAASEAGKAGAASQKAASDAAQAANDKLKEQESLLKAVGDYYGKFGSNIFSTTDSISAVFSSLQALGTGLANNGREFNTVTDSGRANIKALEDSLNAYGATLSDAVAGGTLSIGDAQTKMRQFAGGVRDSLAQAGVSASTLGKLFNGIGANRTSFQGLSGDTKQYAGVLEDAAQSAQKAFNANNINSATAATKELLQYTKDLASYYGALAGNIFQAVDAEGKVFESLQKTGLALATNGTSFNNTTQGGRDNFSALESTFSAFGNLLQQKLTSGTLSSKAAADQYKQFAQGVYSELLRLGVKASDVTSIFSGLGINTSGWSKATAAVGQYAGVLTNAEKAAIAADAAQGKLNATQAANAAYAARLTTEFDKIVSRAYDLSNAADATASAINGITKGYQDALDKVQQLRDANTGLAADIATAQSDSNKAQANYLLAVKYGQTAEAADFLAQRNKANNTVTTDQKQVASNTTQINANAGIGLLTGNTQVAIDNRKSLEDLQNTMLKQIEIYAATGASTAQVTQYSKNLQKEFDNTAKQAGYAQRDVKRYDDVFKLFTQTILRVPRNVNVHATADTSAAAAALRALPTSGRYVTIATTDVTRTKLLIASIPKVGTYSQTAVLHGATGVISVIAHIPKTGTYTVTTRVGSTAALGGIPRSGGYSVTPTLSGAGVASFKSSLKNALDNGTGVPTTLYVSGLNVSNGVTTPKVDVLGNIHAMSVTTTLYVSGLAKGGAVGFASGGLVPGTAPSNPLQDNIMALSPGGLATIRSGEYVQSNPAVRRYGLPFMDAINNMTYVPGSAYTASGGGGGGGNLIGSTMLSTTDRRIIREIATRPIAVVITASRLSSAQTEVNSSSNRAGRN